MGSCSASLLPDPQALLLLWALGTNKTLCLMRLPGHLSHEASALSQEKNPAAEIQERIPESEQGESSEGQQKEHGRSEVRAGL